MDIKAGFAFNQTPTTPHVQQFAPGPGDVLGPLTDLVGVWEGTGFNVIWRPNSAPGQDHFLELNLTSENLEFRRIPGTIANRGLLQGDISMFGAWYLQQISDANTGDGLHLEPGLWATVPATTDPQEQPTVVRLASIPHGTTVLAQGLPFPGTAGPPTIPAVDITPFAIGNLANKVPFPNETNLATPSQLRTPPPGLNNVTQGMVDNPNSVLTAALAAQKIANTSTLVVSSNPTRPVVGGGLENTAFLQGDVGGPNALASLVTATFWLETIDGDAAPNQLQYTQTVLLNFNGLSWPHVTVATLRRQPPPPAN